MIRALIIFGVLIDSAVVAGPIDRTKLWTDAEVDAQARKWGEEVVKEIGASSQHEALTQWREDILNSHNLPVDERIKILSSALDKISRFSTYQVAERIEIYDLAQSEMASIPDHTKYFTDPIEESWRSNSEKVRKIEFPPDWETQVEKRIQSGGSGASYMEWSRAQWQNYENILSENLGMLGRIPSTESVKALGHYLRERDEPDFKIYTPVTGMRAAENLTELISDGPMQTWQASWEDVPKWQQWFDEVKVGKRTFRFVGSDVDYTLDGPADAATLKRIRERNSNSQRPNIAKRHAAPSNAPADTNQKGPVFHGGLLAVILLCLAVSTYFFKHRAMNGVGVWGQSKRIHK